MMEPILPTAMGAVMKEVGKRAIQAYQAQQLAKAQAVIEKKLRQGKYWAISSDKAAAVTWRYMRAAIEGSARRNLELLAEALVNGAVDPEFAPDEFKRQADRLEGLNRNEVLVLAAFIKTMNLPADDTAAAIVVRYRAAVAEMIHLGIASSEDEADGEIASLVRTGWIAPSSGYSFFGYVATPGLAAIARLVDFDAAAAREFDGSDLS